MKKLCLVATIPAIVHTFLRSHIEAAAQKYEVTVVCNATDAHLIDGLPARVVWLGIERKPSPWRDLQVLIQLIRLFQRESFDIVHSHFPKTGLLGMLAAWVTRVPIRIHTFHGEVWATRAGIKRRVLKLMDAGVASLATHVLAVSRSQQQFLMAQGILKPGHSSVMGAGSICGVDSARFQPDEAARRRVRQQLGIAQNVRLILYMGRLNRDKGLFDLLQAFKIVCSATTGIGANVGVDAGVEVASNVHLLLVGTQEDISFGQLQELAGSYRNRLHYVTFTNQPEHYMAAADLFCLPSYREGFGMTIIEAAACGVPAVATRISGIVDAVEDGSTGLLVAPGQADELSKALVTLLSDDPLRAKMGQQARDRVLTLFPAQAIANEMVSFYDTLTNPATSPAPASHGPA